MDSEEREHRNADWAPGTLDKTRKNIGDIDPAEAKKMAKVLGGEVLGERSEPIHQNSNKPAAGGKIIRNDSSSSGTGSATTAGSSQMPQHHRNREELPEISFQVNSMIDKLMMSPDYKIKPNYGFFNFIRKLQKNGTERIAPDFCDITLKNHIENIESFITIMKTLIQIAPNTYKAKIVSGTEDKFKFLRMVAGWKMQEIKLCYIDLTNVPGVIVTTDLIPIVRAIYKPLISVYYYGDTKIPKLIKEIYADEAAYPDAPRAKLSDMAKQAITQWLYLDTEIIRKLYPLLMRMASTTYEVYPDYFTKNIADVLKFTGLHKFDLLLPEKPKAAATPAADAEKPKQAREIKGRRDEVVDSGIMLLDRLFPQAGFKKLDTHPDLYPYFQPLYKFGEGFNMLSPENPLQVTVVLIRILEDLFQGCRNVKFTETPDNSASGKKEQTESMAKIIDDWSAYRENVFERLYCDPLKDLVNRVYSQSDFGSTQFGKKIITSLLWQTTYHYLPSFHFEQLLLERPSDDSKFRPLFMRTSYARNYLMNAVNECDRVAKTRGPVQSVQNAWDHYNFDISNEISKRLDVLLGGQNKGPTTNATNANLLKYTLCIIAVLDWWINNPDSPAYATSPLNIYRISPEDGKPVFSVEERNDQNKLFADEIKAAYTHKQ